MEHETATAQGTAPNPISRREVSEAMWYVGKAIDLLRPGLREIAMSDRTPCELLAGYARDTLSTTHSLLCSALCDVKQDWRK